MKVTGNAIEPVLIAAPHITDHSHTHSWTLYGYVLRSALVLFVFSLVFSLSAENGYLSHIQLVTEFFGELTSSVGTEPQSIYTCSDDGVVALVKSVWEPEDIIILHGVTIVRLDNLGNQLWQTTLPYYEVRWLTGVGIDENDTVSFLVAHSYGEFSDPSAYLVHVFSDGSVERILLSSGLYNTHFNKALRTETGDIIAVGYENVWVEALQQWQIQAAFYRFSPEGAILSTAFIPPDVDSFLNTEAYDAVIDESGNVLIGCRINPSFNDLIKLDLNGNTLDRITLPGNIPNVNWCKWVFLSHKPGSDHTFAVYTHYGTLPYPNQYLLNIACITDTSTTYQTFYGSAIIVPFSIQEVENDLIIAARQGTPFTITSIFRLSNFPTFEILWQWTNDQLDMNVNGDRSADLLSISQNNCIIAVGHSGTWLAVAKLLPNGQVPVSDEYQVPTIHSISAYPNPMRGILYIKLNKYQNDNQIKRLSIFNIRGQNVRDLNIQRNGSDGFSTEWDGRDNNGKTCSTGIYILKESDGQFPVTKIIKQ